MNAAPHNRLSSDVLIQLLAPYDLNVGDLDFLGYSQNHVYACRRDGGKCIVRISHGRYRTKTQMDAELTWIQELHRRGVKVCLPIPSRTGESCVDFGVDGERYLVTCFTHAPGSPITPSEIGAGHYEKLGRLLGQLHKEAADCASMERFSARPYWYDSRLLRQDLASHQQSLTPRFCESVDDLIQRLGQLPRDTRTFGLLHGDVSFKNCYLHEGDLWVFDFDNCEHGYFLQDLATVLYDSVYCRVLTKFADPGLSTRMAPLWKRFWAGYCSASPLQQISSVDLQRFFLLREAVIYLHYRRILDPRSMNDSLRAGLEVMRLNVERQEHQVDFASLL